MKITERVEGDGAAREGLRGWKAGCAIFGCGTLAAFSVFGGLVGGASLLFSASSSGLPVQDIGPAGQEVNPRDDVGPGELNICEKNIPYMSSIEVTRLDDGGGYEDTLTMGGEDPRVVSDECHWQIRPDYSSFHPWIFSYWYEVILFSSDVNAEETASREFESRVEGLASRLQEVKSEGEADFSDRSYFVYGSGSEGQSFYIAVVQTRSAVYEISFEEDSGSMESADVPEIAFSNEARKIVSFMDIRFQVWIPASD